MAFVITQPYATVENADGTQYFLQSGVLYSSQPPYAAATLSLFHLSAQVYYNLLTGAFSAGGVTLSIARKARLPKTLNMIQTVMASPPTTTLTQAHTIASPKFWATMSSGAPSGNAPTLGSFSFCKAGNPVAASQGYPKWFYPQMTNVNYGGGSQVSNCEAWSFNTYSTAIEIYLSGQGQTVLIKINDQYLSLTPQTFANDGGFYYLYIPFGSLDIRRVDIISNASGVFGGVYTAATETVEPAPIRGSSVVVMGDSFTEGTGATFGSVQSYVQIMADALGWDNVISSGVGSTGFLATTGSRLTYRQRFATDLFIFNPDYVLLHCSGNDVSFTIDQLQTEWALCVAAIKANLPNTIIGMVGTWCTRGPGYIGTGTFQMSDAAKAFCARNEMFYISAADQILNNPVPFTTTLAAGYGAFNTSITTAAPLTPGEVYKYPDGNRFRCLSVGGVGPYSAVIDNMQTAQLSGATITQVGQSIWSGSGHVGGTQGDGSCDTIVSADSTHPSTAGHKLLGQTLAAQFLQAVQPNLYT